MQTFWTEIRDWAAPNHDTNYTIRDRILGITNENTYSINNTLLREARSTIWKARLSKKLLTLRELKQKLIAQSPTLLLVITNPALK